MNPNKRICLDEVSMRFLRSLKTERLKMGISQRKLGQMIGCIRSLISVYESGKRIPSVSNLVKLAEVLEYDLSTSVNYKYYHGLINWQELRERFIYFDVTLRELGSYIAYTTSAVHDVFFCRHNLSLDCLNAILTIFENERKLLDFRKELLSVRERKHK